MGETKLKYMIGYGIYPYLKEYMLEDLKCMPFSPFSFRFDESTTSQVRKQYDRYITNYSKKEKKVSTRYVGSLFVGRCTHADLLDHFFNFMENLKLNTDFLIGLGMDGPSVNKAFEESLIDKLEKKKGNSFLAKILFLRAAQCQQRA